MPISKAKKAFKNKRNWSIVTWMLEVKWMKMAPFAIVLYEFNLNLYIRVATFNKMSLGRVG